MQYFKVVNNPDARFYQADEDVLNFNKRFVNAENDILFNELDRQISINEINKGS